jgi:hypothetical protein
LCDLVCVIDFSLVVMISETRGGEERGVSRRFVELISFADRPECESLVF